MTEVAPGLEQEAPFPERFLARFEQKARALAGGATYAIGLETLLPFDQYTEALLLAVPRGTMWKSFFEDFRVTVQAKESRITVLSATPVYRTLSLQRHDTLNKVALHVELEVAFDAFGGDALDVVANLNPKLNIDPYGSLAGKLYVSQKSANPFTVEDNPLAWFDALMGSSI